MKKFLLICLFLSVNSLSQSHFSQTPQATPTPDSKEDTDVIEVSTTLIQVDLIVTDKKNNPVKNLKLKDFEIFEDGKKREVTNFSFISSKTQSRPNNETSDNLGFEDDKGTTLKEKIKVPTRTITTDSSDIRRTLVLVVDNLGLNFSSVKLVKSSLKKFIKEEIKSGDLVTIVTTSGSRVLPSFTSDKKQLLATLNKIKWNPQSRGGADNYEPIRNTLREDVSESRGIDSQGTKQEVALIKDLDSGRKSNSAAGTLGALRYIVQGMKDLPGRKALVLFSEGFSLSDNNLQTSKDTNIDTSTDRFSNGISGAYNLLVKTANQSSVVIYAIDPRGLQYTGMANSDDDIRKAFGRTEKRVARDAEFKQTQEGLRVLAKETGGFAVLNTNNLKDGLKRVIDDQSYYLLSYITDLESVASAKEVYEKIEIKVNDPNLKVRYRSAFYSEESKKNPAGEALTPREKIGQALAFPFKANEIDLNLYSIIGNDKYGEFVKFLINISAKDLDFQKAPKGLRQANFDILAITLDVEDKPVEQFAKNFTISVNEATYKNILNKGFVYVLPVNLKKSGVYHFRVAIRDSKTGKVGAAAKFLETPKFEKKILWLSNLTLRSDTKNSEKPIDPENDKQVFTDTTLRHFTTPATLNYGAVIYNAKTKGDAPPNLTIQTRLVLDDKIIQESTETPISIEKQNDLQRIDLSGKIKLENSLIPGDYILQIIVIDNLAKKKTQVATQLIDFEITK